MPFLILAAFLLLLETLMPSGFSPQTPDELVFGPPGVRHGHERPSQTDVKEHLVAGSEAFAEGDADAALSSFGEATQDENMGGVALYNQGCAHMQAEDWTSARTTFDKAAQQLQDTGLEELAHNKREARWKNAAEAIERAKQTETQPQQQRRKTQFGVGAAVQQQQQQQQQQQDRNRIRTKNKIRTKNRIRTKDRKE